MNWIAVDACISDLGQTEPLQVKAADAPSSSAMSSYLSGKKRMLVFRMHQQTVHFKRQRTR